MPYGSVRLGTCFATAITDWAAVDGMAPLPAKNIGEG